METEAAKVQYDTENCPKSGDNKSITQGLTSTMMFGHMTNKNQWCFKSIRFKNLLVPWYFDLRAKANLFYFSIIDILL